MNKTMGSLIFCLCLFVLAGCVISVGAESRGGNVDSVFGSITVADGKHMGHIETVNGSIELGDKVTAGKLETVNGGIETGSHCKFASAETVNGDIEVGQNSDVRGTLETVNGDIELAANSRVGGNIETVNGDILLETAHASKNVETVNGDIKLRGKTLVMGNIIFEEPGGGWFNDWFTTDSHLHIDAKAEVKGEIHLHRPVKLHIAKGAAHGKIFHHYRKD